MNKVLVILVVLSTPSVFTTDTGSHTSEPLSLKTLAVAKESTRNVVPPANRVPLTSPLLYTEGGTQNGNASAEIKDKTLEVKAKKTEEKDKKAEVNLGATADTPEKKLSLMRESSSVKSSIKPRKGVETELNISAHSLPNDTNHPKLNIIGSILPVNGTTSDNTTKIKVKPIKNDTVHTKVAHKPLILSGDELDLSPLPASSKVNIESSARLSQSASSSAHPDLVIPVTITVFALPLFAVLGYYALKHGREAWKNRHYRRMDFLLDGMYND